MDDLTILYITANRMPQKWVDFALGHLERARRGAVVISISRTPMNYGTNILDDAESPSYWNIYRQMLRGARMAKTAFVAMAEDDVLYTPEHFSEFRPEKNQVAYDRSRWSLFSWDPIYCLRQRLSNCSLVAPRDYLIDALEEREARWPQGPAEELVGEVGREKVDRRLGVSVRACVEYYCSSPIVQLNHPGGSEDRQKIQWKRHGQIRAYDIPVWGKATDLVKQYEAA